MNAITIRIWNETLVLIGKNPKSMIWMQEMFRDCILSQFYASKAIPNQYSVNMNGHVAYVPVGFEVDLIFDLQGIISPLERFEVISLPLWVEALGDFYPVHIYPHVEAVLSLKGNITKRHIHKPVNYDCYSPHMLEFHDELIYVNNSVAAWKLYKAGAKVLSPKITRQGEDIHAHDLFLVSMSVEENSGLWKKYFRSQMWDMNGEYTVAQWFDMHDDATKENVNWWVS